MASFKLDDSYIDVAKRIDIFRTKYPEGSLGSRIVTLPEAFAAKFIAVEAMAYRSPDDPCPGVGLAWEPVPGPTSFTKDSELMNAQTSAWGRAIVASLAADTKKGIASHEEVRNRQSVPVAAPAVVPPSADGNGATAERGEQAGMAVAPPSRSASQSSWTRYTDALSARAESTRQDIKATRDLYVRPYCTTHGLAFPPMPDWTADRLDAIAELLELNVALGVPSEASQ